MLPIYNLTGEVMAFGGRALGDDPPKYLNTPNTAAYTKGHHVYALQLARRAAAAEDALIVVEGYLDVIARTKRASATPSRASARHSRQNKRANCAGSQASSISASTATRRGKPRPRAASTCWSKKGSRCA